MKNHSYFFIFRSNKSPLYLKNKQTLFVIVCCLCIRRHLRLLRVVKFKVSSIWPKAVQVEQPSPPKTVFERDNHIQEEVHELLNNKEKVVAIANMMGGWKFSSAIDGLITNLCSIIDSDGMEKRICGDVELIKQAVCGQICFDCRKWRKTFTDLCLKYD